MTPAAMTVLIAVCGGLGAGSRFGVDETIRRHEHRFPAGTMIINISGSLLLGWLAGWTASGLPTVVSGLAGTGFLGGYTTFSTACLEVVRLGRDRRIAAALAHAVGTLLLGTAAAAAGWAVGQVM